MSVLCIFKVFKHSPWPQSVVFKVSWSVTNVCVLYLKHTGDRWTDRVASPWLPSAPSALLSFAFVSHSFVLFFVSHVQFCKAKSRCNLSQVFSLQRSLTVSSALTYNTPLLSTPLHSSPTPIPTSIPIPISLKL